MNLPNIKILDEKDKILRKVSKEVTFPLEDATKQTIFDAINYLKLSQDEEIAEKYDLRPGMGLAFIQLGIPKRIFVIANKDEDTGKFEEHIIINPVITSQSEEMIYVGEGEGCLSVNRPVDGIVPRCARITLNYQDMDGNHKKIRVREDIAIAFQHEIDHLNGILFVDKIDKKNPFKNKDKMREI
ncbi:MAG: peptide deformylase [Firmicutes bacterium]|nr:peptide deformylase [Bacillota bacterium]